MERQPDDTISGETSVDSTGKGHDARDEARRRIPWPHAPLHLLGAGGTFMVTAGTYHKQLFFTSPGRLNLLHDGLLTFAHRYGWQLEAWAVFANHYHFVGQSPVGPAGADSLRKMVGKLHEFTAKRLNEQDRTPGRTVWHNFWDSRLTYEKSYFARLNYTHQNAVRHGLAAVANQYPWCSAAWFERVADPSRVKTIYAFKTDRVRVEDDFDVE